MDHDRAIEQQMAYLQRRTDHDDHRPRDRSLANLTQTLATTVEHRPLMEQIVASVGGNPQLGEKCKYYLTFDRLLRQCDGFGGVEGRIGNSHPRNSDRDADEIMIIQVEEIVAPTHYQLFPLDAA